MILNITSFPRSGNSFFTSQILQFGTEWRHKGNPVQFKPVGRLYAGGENKWYGIKVEPWCDGLQDGVEDPQPNRYIADQSSLYVYKRHDYPDNYGGPRILLVRDGRDVLYSYAHHNAVNKAVMADRVNQAEIAKREIPADVLNREARRILDDPNGQWGPLVEHQLDHLNTVSVVRYENMKWDTVGTLTRALAQAGYGVEKVKEAPSWAKLKEFAPHFYWRGKSGGHTKLDPVIVREFVRRNHATLKRLDYL
jgi:hypothetical protein